MVSARSCLREERCSWRVDLRTESRASGVELGEVNTEETVVERGRGACKKISRRADYKVKQE